MRRFVILWWVASCMTVLTVSNWPSTASEQLVPQYKPLLIMVPTVTPSPTDTPLKSVLLEVPFTSQAPYGEWSDKRHQDGCEETSILMAYCALDKDKCEVTNGVLDKEYAKSEIEKMASWELDNYESYVDTSANDTAKRLLDEYFGIKNYQIKQVGSWSDIAKELNKGNIVVTPMNGQKLNNPNFTGLGPERHMILVRGVDMNKKEFITNDPGTRKGEMYRYPVNIYWNAIRDYATGDHKQTVVNEKKMIVIGN